MKYAGFAACLEDDRLVANHKSQLHGARLVPHLDQVSGPVDEVYPAL